MYYFSFHHHIREILMSVLPPLNFIFCLQVTLRLSMSCYKPGPTFFPLTRRTEQCFTGQPCRTTRTSSMYIISHIPNLHTIQIKSSSFTIKIMQLSMYVCIIFQEFGKNSFPKTSLLPDCTISKNGVFLNFDITVLDITLFSEHFFPDPDPYQLDKMNTLLSTFMVFLHILDKYTCLDSPKMSVISGTK